MGFVYDARPVHELAETMRNLEHRIAITHVLFLN